ncbi:MAG TPA: hypothetical protein VN213_10310 [Solirubrobacteraceae bacterium]|nr:hypothetical protein [Solirubrobacteraceae bacterium]
MASLLGIVRDEYAVAGSLLASLIPGIVLLWDVYRDEARIVRIRRERD